MADLRPQPEIITELWTFAQRIRYAAGVLCEVAVHQGVEVHEGADTPYRAKTLDRIADSLDAEDRARDEQIELLARDLFDSTFNEAGNDTWPNSLYANSCRERARELHGFGWRKDGVA